MSQAREIAEKLEVIRGYAKLYPNGAQGQMIGQETWRIVLSGESLQWITAAADKLIELEQLTSVPVLTVECEPDYWSGGHYYEGTKSYIAPSAVWKLPIGTKLYTAPAAAERDPELVRDAERYRWLRSYNTAKHPDITEAFFWGDENLDAEIDAAIAAKKGGQS